MWVLWIAAFAICVAITWHVVKVMLGLFLPLSYSIKALPLAEMHHLRIELSDRKIFMPEVDNLYIIKITDQIVYNAKGFTIITRINKHITVMQGVEDFIAILSVRIDPSSYENGRIIGDTNDNYDDLNVELIEMLRPSGFTLPMSQVNNCNVDLLKGRVTKL